MSPIKTVKVMHHCSDCIETDCGVPMPARQALVFGAKHSQSIVDQSVRGLPRTLPLWATVALLARCKIPQRAQRSGCVVKLDRTVDAIVMTVAMQAIWTAGFAVFSGGRTTLRLATQSPDTMTAIELQCARGGLHVVACAHCSTVGASRYVDGVFSWPRHRGGGRAVIDRVIRRADADGVSLTLTALSPSVARMYRRVGFRPQVSIYFMRRPNPRASWTSTAT